MRATFLPLGVFQRSLWNWRHIVAIVRISPTTSFLPDLAHERATSPLFKASAFAFRSFPLLIRLPLAFAPLGNKGHHHHQDCLTIVLKVEEEEEEFT